MSDKLHVDGSSLLFPPQPLGSTVGHTMQESVYSPRRSSLPTRSSVIRLATVPPALPPTKTAR